ncbi:2-dehydro-3-deoxy-6-phosphogalactonate aldolase [Niveibacterium sp. SC-1]|uniref:2-dehydro-3-deoxy-6-phosphogalactonate aldolase n=1 Tax=Niveibacterium sp. SC-1 TaxID=3135646 RepID=UPI00312012B2
MSDWLPDALTTLPLIAILRGIRPEEVPAQLDALLAAGFRAIEIPSNSPDWEASLQRAVAHVGTRALVGGGTVTTLAQVAALAASGAGLMLSPNTDAEIIAAGRAAGLEVIPGVATPSECFAALKAGASALKLFPADTLGPAFVRGVKSVLPPVPLYAVGGVSARNLHEYLAAGCTGAGFGGALYRAGQPENDTAIHAREIVDAYRRCQSESRP